MSAPQLRPYQAATLDAIVAAHAAGNNRLLVKKPTGTGKTVTFAAMLRWPAIKDWLAQFKPDERRMLVIAHREELLTQSLEKIQKANPGLMCSIEQGDKHANSYSDVVIASIQTLAAVKFRRLHALLKRHKFRIVIVDEAHHAAAASYRTALVHLGFLPPADISTTEDAEAVEFDDVAVMAAALETWDRKAPKDRLLVGMTATPNRSDAIGLGCVFQTLAYSYDLKAAIDDGWLVPITPWVVETAEVLDQVRTTAGDFNQKDLAEAVNTEARNKIAVAAWREHADRLSTIAFTVDVAHAHALADAFVADGVKAIALSGETPKEERRRILAAYTAGDIEVVTNCMVLTEGTDLPRTGCILHAKPTKSATLYEQMTGRGLRIHPGKTECIVIDVVDIARRHSLQTAPVLYGLPPGVKTKGENLKQLAEAIDEFRSKYPGYDLDEAFKREHMSLADLNARASSFDIWNIPTLGAFGNGRALNWLRVGAESYRLQYPWADGTEILNVGKDLIGKWEVSLTLRPREQGGTRQRTLATGVATSDAAAGLAEAFVLQERRSVAKMKDTSAPWRGNPASEKQTSLLTRLRVPVPPNCTAGQASDLIDLAMARKRG